MRALVSALLLSLASPVIAGEAAPWRSVNAETGKISDVEGLEQLAKDFPDSGSVRVRLLNTQLAADDGEAALATLGWLKERGYVFSAAAQKQIPELLAEGHAEAAMAALLPKARIIEASEVVATVPADAGIVESVRVPAGSIGLYIVTSVNRNMNYLATAEGGFPMDIPAGANDLSGMVETPDGDETWLASANLDGSVDDAPAFSGLIGYVHDKKGEVFVPAPKGVAVSDLAIGADGTVYASDPINGGVYFMAPKSGDLAELVALGTFRSPQGLAVSADGSKLYVSDYRYGIAIVDVRTRKVSRLVSDIPALLDGTDGLWLHKGELIAVQNGTSPMRISAFKLSEDGTRIVGHRILEQAHSGWTEPLGGSIHDDGLIYVATGQWDRYDKGKLKEGMEAIPTEIRRLPLSTMK